MRAARGSVKIVLGLIVGAGLYESLFVREGMGQQLWVLLVAGALVLLGLWVLRALRLED